MVAKAARVDSGRDEAMAQGMHLGDGGCAGGVAVVVGVGPLGHGGAGGWLHGYESGLFALGEIIMQEGESEA